MRPELHGCLPRVRRARAPLRRRLMNLWRRHSCVHARATNTRNKSSRQVRQVPPRTPRKPRRAPAPGFPLAVLFFLAYLAVLGVLGEKLLCESRARVPCATIIAQAKDFPRIDRYLYSIAWAPQVEGCLHVRLEAGDRLGPADIDRSAH